MILLSSPMRTTPGLLCSIRKLTENSIRACVNPGPIAFAFILLLSACATHDRSGIAPPANSAGDYQPTAVSVLVRAYGDELTEEKSFVVSDIVTGLSKRGNATGLNVLALSGGGPDGAFGAGFLKGWSQKGDRPEFDIVTGISTGALIAPFAFLGSEYDSALGALYTTTDTQSIARMRVVRSILFGGPLARSDPLRRAIQRQLTDDKLAKIALEHQRGRRLLIGTTNFDAERPVIWDLGEIASQGTPEAFALARDVILASASIPVLFNPVPITVSNGIDVRSELHVDGALTQQMFTYPVNFPMREVLLELELASKTNTIWLIFNKRLEAQYIPQNTRLIPMIERTLSTASRAQGLNEAAFIASLAERDGFVVNGAAIPSDFLERPNELFDIEYMRALYSRGLSEGLGSDAWVYDVASVIFSN